MNTLADLFVILLCLSGFFVILSLVCAVLERLPEETEARPRRTRLQPNRSRRRSRVVRLRNQAVQPITESPRTAVLAPVVMQGRGG